MELRLARYGSAMAGELTGETSADRTGADASLAHFGTAYPALSFSIRLFSGECATLGASLANSGITGRGLRKEQVFGMGTSAVWVG